MNERPLAAAAALHHAKELHCLNQWFCTPGKSLCTQWGGVGSDGEAFLGQIIHRVPLYWGYRLTQKEGGEKTPT